MTNKKAVCLACKAGFHDECQDMWDDRLASNQFCCCEGLFNIEGNTAYENFDEPEELEAYFDGYTGSKNLDSYSDPISTGRKEAAKKFPIKPGMVCEWAWLRYAGGGIEPIIGCPGHPAEAIHHGPDKNTMRNVEGNIHRICAECHNRWHAANDPYYGERPTTPDGKIDASVPFHPLNTKGERIDPLPHDPVTLAPDEQIHAEDKRRRDEARRHGTIPKVTD
jgi:hypothetical protein